MREREAGFEGTPRVRVLLVWCHRILGEATAASLAQRDDLEVVAATGRPAEAEGIVDREPVDVLLVDASLDGGPMAELIFALKDRCPGLRVVAFGLSSDERAVELIEAGADDVVTGEGSLEEVVRAVLGAGAGADPAPLALAARIAARIEELRTRRPPRRVESHGDGALSERELEVLDLVARGLRNKEIAQRLGIRTATVKNHVHSVLAKLGARRRREAVRIAYEEGLLDGPLRWRLLDAEE